MVVTKISSEFTVSIPAEFRTRFTPDEQVAVSMDSQGRLVVTPIEQIRAVLEKSFGMWADRTDTPTDGVAYMDEIRRGHPLEDLWHFPENDAIGQVLDCGTAPVVC